MDNYKGYLGNYYGAKVYKNDNTISFQYKSKELADDFISMLLPINEYDLINNKSGKDICYAAQTIYYSYLVFVSVTGKEWKDKNYYIIGNFKDKELATQFAEFYRKENNANEYGIWETKVKEKIFDTNGEHKRTYKADNRVHIKQIPLVDNDLYPEFKENYGYFINEMYKQEEYDK